MPRQPFRVTMIAPGTKHVGTAPASARLRARQDEVATMRRTIPIPLLCLALTAAGGGPLFAADGVPRFQDDVRPLLQAKCVRCHGEKPRKAGLDLSTPAGILKGGESGPAAVPGKADGSPLFEKVRA